jgi:hypothetical protein
VVALGGGGTFYSKYRPIKTVARRPDIANTKLANMKFFKEEVTVSKRKID